MTYDEYPTYYAVIEAEVRYDRRLTASEKLLYAEISALTNASGACTARNAYFVELYGQGESTIRRWISNLAKYGYIKVKCEGKSRVITLFKKLQTRSKMSNKPSQKREGSNKYNLNNKYIPMNNTRENNTHACVHETLSKKSIVGDVQFDEEWLEKNLSPKQLQFHKAFPNKILNIEDGQMVEVPDEVDMDKLIQKINESIFLKRADNVGLRSCCIDRYQEIMADAYKTFNPNDLKRYANFKGREYTQGELNTLIQSIDEIEI